MMKNQKNILQDMIADAVAEQDQVTFFGKNSVLRAWFSALSHTIAELWNDIYQVKRQMQVQTAAGADLDLIAERRGIARNTATKGTCIAIIFGPADIVIPADYLIRSVSGVLYRTISEITLGAKNPNVQRPVYSNILGDVVIAESLESGSKVKVGIKELNSFVIPIEGVTVTNLVPSAGGADLESDENFRNRIANHTDVLNQGTQAFYEALARAADVNVLRALASYNSLTAGTNLYILKNTLAPFTEEELTAIEDYVYPRQRALSPVLCFNATLIAIEIEAFITTTTGTDFQQVYSTLAAKLSEYIDHQKLSYGDVIKYYDILDILVTTAGVLEVDTDFLSVNNGKEDITCGGKEMPRFTSFTLKNQHFEKAESIQQSYLIL